MRPAHLRPSFGVASLSCRAVLRLSDADLITMVDPFNGFGDFRGNGKPPGEEAHWRKFLYTPA
jgi:hypothetical protein